jgi:hypothetical protein
VTLTWLYNASKGSLLLVAIMHASSNTTGIFFPMANLVSSENMGAYIGYCLFEVLVAIIVVFATRPARFSRTKPLVIQEKSLNLEGDIYYE